MTDRLMNGEKLDRGQTLTSRNGAYTFTLQDDGNPVLYAAGQAVRAVRSTGAYAVVSGDTLWVIPERFYGDGSKYQMIAEPAVSPSPT